MWSKYEAEDDGVFIACSSIYGNTLEACKKLKEILEKEGNKKVELYDITRTDVDQAISKAFQYKNVIFASSSYNAGLFPPMEQLLTVLKGKNYQNRKIGLIENGTWAPSAAKRMKEIISDMKNIDLIENVVTIKSTLDEESKKALDELAQSILK